MLEAILNALKTLLGFQPTIVSISVTKAIVANGSTHDAGDVMNDALSGAWVFRNAARIAGGSGYIMKAQAHTEVELQSHRIALQVFTQYPTCTLTDDSDPVSPNPDDEPFFEDEVALPALAARGDGSYTVATPSTVGNLPLGFTCEPGDRDLYIVPIAVDATTHTAGERLTIKLQIERVNTERD